MPRANDDANAPTPPALAPAALPATVYVGPLTDFRDDLSIRVPGAKYYTLRYLLAALLADPAASLGAGGGWSRVANPALSDDTRVLVDALTALGARLEWQRDRAHDTRDDGWALRILGTGGKLQTPPGGVINTGNAGAVTRLLLGLGALLPEVRFETDHPGSLGKRPNADLLHALESLGIQIEAGWPDGLLPITLRGGPPRGGAVSVSGAQSSQYLSALLYLAPLLPDGLDITVAGRLRSAPLVRATLRVLAEAGITVESSADLLHHRVPGGQRYQPLDVTIPGDVPSAAALLAAASAADIPLTLPGIDVASEDARPLLDAFRSLGADIERSDVDGNALYFAPDILSGAVVDGDAIIDSVPVLVAAACFAEGETRIENVANLRLKESDRINDLCAELQRAGCAVTPLPDAIVAQGNPRPIPGGVTVDGHDDHRLVQALAIVALRSQHGLTITGADAIAKSYPTFFAELARMGADVRAV